MFVCSRSEGPHVESENGPSAYDDVYGPQPQAAEKKLLSEETKPTLSGPHSTLGKLPTATHILNSILNNYDHKLRPGIGGEYQNIAFPLLEQEVEGIGVDNGSGV